MSLTVSLTLADLTSCSRLPREAGEPPALPVAEEEDDGTVSLEAIFSRWDGFPVGPCCFNAVVPLSDALDDGSGSLSDGSADALDGDGDDDDVWLLFGWISVLSFNFFFFFLPYEELLLLDDDDDEDDVDDEVYEYDEAEKLIFCEKDNWEELSQKYRDTRLKILLERFIFFLFSISKMTKFI